MTDPHYKQGPTPQQPMHRVPHRVPGSIPARLNTSSQGLNKATYAKPKLTKKQRLDYRKTLEEYMITDLRLTAKEMDIIRGGTKGDLITRLIDCGFVPSFAAGETDNATQIPHEPLSDSIDVTESRYSETEYGLSMVPPDTSEYSDAKGLDYSDDEDEICENSQNSAPTFPNLHHMYKMFIGECERISQELKNEKMQLDQREKIIFEQEKLQQIWLQGQYQKSGHLVGSQQIELRQREEQVSKKEKELAEERKIIDKLKQEIDEKAVTLEREKKIFTEQQELFNDEKQRYNIVHPHL